MSGGFGDGDVGSVGLAVRALAVPTPTLKDI